MQNWPTLIVAVIFVAQELTISIGFGAAQARFADLIHGQWLTEASETAYGEGLTGLLRVGPIRPGCQTRPRHRP